MPDLVLQFSMTLSDPNPKGTADKEKYISKRFYDEESKRNVLAYLQDYNWEEAIEISYCMC